MDMISGNLKKFALDFGLSVGTGVMYGVRNGLAYVMQDNKEFVRVDIVFGDVPAGRSFTLQQLLPVNAEQYKVQNVELLKIGSGISVTFRQARGVLKCVEGFLAEEEHILRSAGLDAGFVCPHCGQLVTDRDAKITLFFDTPAVIHSHCVNDFAAGLAGAMNREEAKAREERSAGSEIRGFIGAVLGALVCAVPWIIVYLLGYQMALLGVLIAFGAAFGHKLLGGKAGVGRVVSIIIATAIAAFVAIFGSETAEVARLIVNGEMAEIMGVPTANFTLGDHLVPFMQMFYSDPGFNSEMMGDRMSGAFMALLGLVAWLAGNYRQARDKKNPKLKITTLG